MCGFQEDLVVADGDWISGTLHRILLEGDTLILKIQNKCGISQKVIIPDINDPSSTSMRITKNEDYQIIRFR